MLLNQRKSLHHMLLLRQTKKTLTLLLRILLIIMQLLIHKLAEIQAALLQLAAPLSQYSNSQNLQLFHLQRQQPQLQWQMNQ